MFITDIGNMEVIDIQGLTVRIPGKQEIPETTFVGRKEIIDNALIAWKKIDHLRSQHFRLYGPPGMGKNAIAYELARILKKDLYIMRGHQCSTPEDMSCVITQNRNGIFEYVATPLLVAMLKGGICLFDEFDKVREDALAPLASVLDDSRTIVSGLLGTTFKAHDDFLFCAALNEYSESEGRVREFIEQRTSPSFYVGYPSLSELEEILKTRISPVSEEVWIDVFMKIFKDIEISVRDAINILEFAYKKSRDENTRLSKKLTEKYLKDALTHFPHVKHNVSAQTKLAGNDNVYFGLKTGREKSIH